MKILVTGGAGFIGSHIAETYLNNGHQVVILDNLSTGLGENIPHGARFFERDIRDFKAIEQILSDERFDVINHHAAQIDVRQSVNDPLEDCTVNINGIVHLYETGRKTGVKKFIFSSSGGTVYGEPDHIPISVTSPLNPLSPYGVSKVASEYYLKCFHFLYRIPTLILRYANVYGPRQFTGEAGVVAIFFEKMIKGKDAVIFGNGEQTRDFIFIDDVVEANCLALDCQGFKTFHIGTARPVSINTLYREISNVTKYARPPIYRPERPGEILKNALDISDTVLTLGWKPKIDLRDGLVKTHNWWRQRLMKREGV